MKKKRLRNSAEVMRDEMHMQYVLKALLKEKPLTIPEISDALNIPSYEIFMWMMAMMRYGSVASMPKGRIDDYYQYKLTEE
jgi:predicted transcriptional regulator